MERWKEYLWNLIGITAGSAILAVAFALFLIPNKIAAGGASGLGILFFHLYQFPVGLTVLLVNVPIFILTWLFLGWRVVAHSLLGSFIFPLLLALLEPLPAVTSDLLLASVFGGIASGIGLGLVFRFQGSTGGTSLGALLINHFWGFSSGQSLVVADLLIILASGFIFNAEVALFALLALLVSARVIDIVQEGFAYSKAALIITREKDKIAARVMNELERGATFLEGRGAYTGDERYMILCVFAQSQVTRLKNIVRETDPGAFVIVTNVGEVHGEGFRRI
ncbi:MAG: YitT family protein [Bacillota bacterium]